MNNENIKASRPFGKTKGMFDVTRLAMAQCPDFRKDDGGKGLVSSGVEEWKRCLLKYNSDLIFDSKCNEELISISSDT
ncbi:hypothetical protein TNCT_583721 [Trichonephila clavata]|uniref:Uncharacterized protein n=1 Tax=Trichonephila clavata TaxID=2740835 RepID=A0A8X6L2V3_TRICU|nr:hypothetical protein TNCT_583721 [Trichonephila clavata]